MIELYTANTPNGIKVPIVLEELGINYSLVRVDLANGGQRRPSFLALNPNGKIPVLVDREGPGGQPLNIAESGAIALYLAEKYGGLMPIDPRERQRAMEFLFLQVASVGPMFGQAGWFMRSAPEMSPMAIDRFVRESHRLTELLEGQLQESRWLSGKSYSLADIMHFCWLRVADYAGVDQKQFPAVSRWVTRIGERPAVLRAIARIQTM